MQTRHLATFLVGCLLAFNVSAEMQYWVSVGSYKQVQEAERARDKAADKMSESFAVIGTDTAKGYFYRVAAGPYLTSELAQDQLVSAKASGFANAWLWSDDVDPLDTNYSLGSVDDSYQLNLPEYSVDIETSRDSASGSGIPSNGYDESFYDESIEEADLIQRRKTPPEVVDKAPPDYKLNKMRRDA